MTLFRRFFLILFAWTFLSIGGVGVLAYRMTASARENAVSYHRQIVEFSQRLLDRFARDLNGEFAFTADLQKLEADSPFLFKELQSAAAAHPGLEFLAIVDASGREQLRFADSKVFPDRAPPGLWDEPARGAARSGSPAFGAVSDVNGRPILPIVYPLKEGRLLYAGVSLESLWTTFKSQHVGPSGRIVLAAKDGAVLPLSAEGLDVPRLPVTSEPEGWLELGVSGKAWLGAWKRFPALDWIVATLQPKNEAYLEADQFASRAILLFALLALGAGFSSAWLSKQIAAPLNELIAGANRTAENKFDVPVKETGWKELRDLSARFNNMMQALKKFSEIQIEKILEEKGKVEALVQTIPEGILMADMTGRVLYVNGNLFELLGQPPRSAKSAASVGQLLKDPKVQILAQTLMRKEKKWVAGESQVGDGTAGSVRYLKILGTVVSPGQRDAGILLLFRDVTTERELENMKQSFFNAIIHDLRAPLTTIQSYLEISRMGRDLTPREEKYYPNVQLAVEDLRRLIEDILDLAKMESGTMELTLAEADMKALAGRIFGLFDLPMQMKGIKLELEAPDGLPPLTLDVRKIERVVSNLLSNARKFTPQGGSVKLRVARTAQGVEVSVADTGPGIPADKLTVVFEKFKQLETGKKEGSGYGLGLTICKSVVEHHGGRIWVESVLGKGSRFAFELPVRAMVSGPSKAPPSSA